MMMLPRVSMAVSGTRGCFSFLKGSEACSGVPPGEVGTDRWSLSAKGVAGADSSEGGGGEATICPAPLSADDDEDDDKADEGEGVGVGESKPSRYDVGERGEAQLLLLLLLLEGGLRSAPISLSTTSTVSTADA
jgi:hypothetical protein